MHPHLTWVRLVGSHVAIVLFSATGLMAQTSSAPGAALAEAVASLRSCVGMVERGLVGDAEREGRRAQALFQARLQREPRDVEGLVGLARAESQCLLPAAEMITQGELSTHAIELLETALGIDPDHWTARFVLASINFRSPSFLGRAPRAAVEFDILLKMQGDRADDMRFARVFEYRGVLWNRAGKLDSAVAIWKRGAHIFPADSALRSLMERASQSTPTPPRAAPAVTLLSVMSVVASPLAAPQPTSSVQVSKSQILMTAGGAADVLQAIQLQPGATRVSEGSDVYTRGGDAGETALLVDGGRLATLSRFEGLSGGMFGAIEPFVVRSVRFSSGGFSVRHGNALSGLIEIETEGRPRERQLRGGLTLVQASGTARVPLSKTVGGWVSARASQTAALLATHGRRDEFQGAPHSEEAIGSLIANLSPTSELRLTGIAERDDARPIVNAAGLIAPFHASGGAESIILSSRWIAANVPVSLRTNVTASRHDTDWEFGVLARRREERIEAARVDAEWIPSEAVTLRSGLEQGARTRRDNGTVPTTGNVNAGSPMRTLEGEIDGTNQVGAYTELQLAHLGTLLVAGLRADRLPGEREATIDPRVSLAMRRGAWTMRAAGGLFHQGRWRAASAVPDAGTPSGLPRSARHLVAGVEREGATSLRAELFDKRYDEYGPFGAGPPITSGRARGLDLSTLRKAGRLSGWLGYSFLDSRVTLTDGTEVRSPFDVTHSATGSMTFAANTDWSVGTTLRYATGLPHTPITSGQHQDDGSVAPVYGAPMSKRLPGYARVDARVMRFLRQPGYLLTSFMEVINLANRRNVRAVAYDAEYRTQTPVHSFFATRTVVVGVEMQLR